MKKKRPALRFSGFDNDWEQRKLGNVADLVGGGTPSTQNPEYWDGDIDWYAPAEIANQIYVKTSQRKITEQGYDNSSAKLLPLGTVLFTSRAGIGKTAILARKGCTNQGFQSIVPHKNELDTYFIFSRTEELKRYGELVGAGSTFVEVSGKQMAAMDLMLPSTIQEQQMIGVFFKQLDHLITLHQCKCKKLICIKKSMLENMFPQKDEKIPRIRFSGFTDAWEQRKLNELVTYHSSNLTASDARDVGKFDLYDANSVIGKTNIEPMNSEYITIIKDGAGVGRIRTMPQNTMFIGTMGGLQVNKSDINFIFSLLTRFDLGKEYSGSTIPHIYFKDYGNNDYYVPAKDEQQAIGQYFTNLDHLITLHQRELEKLQNIKKAMLEKMFV